MDFLKYLAASSILLVAAGCTGKVRVTKLEDAIRDAAIAASNATGSKGELAIELSVVSSGEASGAIPLPYVPIGVKGTRSATRKVTVKIDLSTYSPPPKAEGAAKVYMLNLRNGSIRELSR